MRLIVFLQLLTPAGLLAVDFESEIAPIFEANCSECHGAEKRKGKFRVDRRANLLRGGDSGEAAVVPGDAEASFLLRLIRHEESDLEMPPKGEPLSPDEIALIEKWISEGAPTPESYGPSTEKVELTHWSFRPVRREAGSIDAFVGKRLTQAGLQLSTEADRRTLIRRLFLVMTGLPPSPERVEAFVRDQRENAWQLLVDEVLASPRYGERWAGHWLDLVRFGETHGFETNRERPNAWRFRDWVIAAFNDDKPYDEFVRQQIAGDAFDVPIGTGFLVAGPWDNVKGQDPKLGQMQRMNELDDMINTTGTAFLGLTLGCARCHNHKFDPVSQKDYYSLQAIFAGVNHGDQNLPLPPERKARIEQLDAEIVAMREALKPFIRKSVGGLIAMDDAQADHLAEPRGKGKNPPGSEPGFAGDRGSETRSPNVSGGEYTWWTNEPNKEIAAWRPHLEGRYRIWISWGAGHKTHTKDAQYWLQDEKRGRKLVARVNQQLLADGSGEVKNQSLWSGFYDGGVHDLKPGDSLILLGGVIGTAITADVVIFKPATDKAGKPKRPGIREPVTASHNVDRVRPTLAKFVRFTIDESSSGQPCIDELEIFAGESNVALASTGAKASSGGDFKHALHKLEHINDGKYGNPRSWIAVGKTGWVQIELAEPATIDRIEWARDREKKYADRVPVKYRIEAALEPDEWTLLASSDDRLPFQPGAKNDDAVNYDFDSRPAEEASRGRDFLKRLNAAMKEREEAAKPEKIYAGTFSQPGPTHRLYRGEPDQKREEVGPDAIAAFVSLDLERNAPELERRVALAEWITNPENPLTARVIANRVWQFHFGTGIVDTPSDFGLNGTPPSHPQLLDWLAAELVENGWSLKHLHRVILNSATWKQDSRPRAEAMKIDAASRLLWRFPTRRLEAEGIRDSILAVSGSLDLENASGPGFSPFEVEMENVRHYHPKKTYGPDDWRRMIFMTKVRQEREQVFGAFDCPDASQAVAKRSRSTTPLQALNLLNSNFVMQQAEILAERLRTCAKTQAQIMLAWELCFGRPPDDAEIEASLDFIGEEGLVQFCRAMLNANEFVFIP